MALDKKILSEIQRYNSINKYIMEQDAPPPPADPLAPTGPGAGAPPPPDAAAAPAEEPAGAQPPQPLDIANDPDVEKIDDDGKAEDKKGEEDTEELDVTELVDSQKNIETKQTEYFENLFNQISNLEKKLGEMDQIMSKLNNLENKIEKYRQKTPEERLELRSYDSYPFNQKLSDFFDDKKQEMEMTGKRDYVLTSDEVTDMNVNDVKNSFQPGQNSTDQYEFRK